MGMGEPFDNLSEVLRAVSLLSDDVAFAYPASRITVSTVGVADKFETFFANTKAELAISLHAPDDARRSAIMPINKRFDLATLRARCGERVVSLHDPFYGRQKNYRACPLREALRIGFGEDPAWLAGHDVVFRATDGYAKPSLGSRVVEDGGFLAFSDADVDAGGAPAFAPIDRKQADPAPFYVVWANPGQDEHHYPWPYQLAEIDVSQMSDLYPHIFPTGEKEGSAALAGYETFKTNCIACHSVNGEGGKIGPDLNVPKSIVEYRPVEQIKQYVRNPETFRYSNMPAHDFLDDRQLDQLVAYFSAMSRRKHDPGKGS